MVGGALAGKVAVVTGASRGLGRATSHELAKDGARIALVGRDSGKLDEVVREITSNGGRAQAFQADVSSEDAVLELERGVAAAMGPVSILVNNAGINIRKQMTEYSLEEWRRVLGAS
jgi:NAD(P)-dependent dehydrogenase (short-subunit alcohol dehydrogenase family)